MVRRGVELDETVGDLLKPGPFRTLPKSTVKARATPPHHPPRKWKRATLLLLVALFGVTVVFWPYQQLEGQWRLGHGAHRAALVDSLSATDPDPSFITNVTMTLSSAGYSVDYYNFSRVTVDLFRDLPLIGYSIVMFRTHTATAAFEPPGQNIVTHQLYTTSQYSLDQLVNHVTAAIVRPGDTFFAITPSFISDEKNGGYQGALIIQMGCSTLQPRPDLATAFLGRGARAFVGWTGTVSSYYTDVSTERFLASLLHGASLEQAVSSTQGPDPEYGGTLAYVDASSVSQQLMINQLTTIAISAIVLAIALIVIRKLEYVPRILRRKHGVPRIWPPK